MWMFGVTIDAWAAGKSATNYTTMTIQTFCVLLTLILICIQTNFIIKKREMLKGNWRQATLLCVQLAMMFFSAGYMITHFWNYVYQYATTPNPIKCELWYGLLITNIVFSRIFLMAFLMLRSSFAFNGTFCELSTKISAAVIGFNALGNCIALPIVLVDNIPIHPIPGKGFCWRILGEAGEAANFLFHVINFVISTIAVLIFYWKARSVQKIVGELMKDNKLNTDMIEIDAEFKKHIRLGMITVAGGIILFFVQDLLSVLMGIVFAIDQTVNNILTFIMFKENQVVYKWLLCRCRSFEKAKMVEDHKNIKTEPSTNATASTGTTDTTGTADTTGTLSPDFVQNTSTTDKTLPEVTVEDTI